MGGRVIIFPTDTVYGIGTQIFDILGIDKIYKIKNRSKDKPLACLCADINQIKSVAVVNEKAKMIIEEFLPGPLTLILKSTAEVYNKIGYETIGVRIPNNEIALNILKENGPMLTTSVNESGDVPLNEYEEICVRYNNIVDKIYNTNSNSSNISSTVVKLLDDKVEVLREGQISINQINKLV